MRARSSSSQLAVMVTSDARMATNKTSIMTVKKHQNHPSSPSLDLIHVRSFNCIPSITTTNDIKRSTSRTTTGIAPHTTTTRRALQDCLQNGQGPEPWGVNDGNLRVEAARPVPHPREE